MEKTRLQELRPYEIYGGILWLLLYQFAMGRILEAVLPLMGMGTDATYLNGAYFFLNFIITGILFHRFLADSLFVRTKGLLKMLRGLLLGYIAYEALQIAVVLVTEQLFPQGLTANDQQILEIADANFRVMWVGAVLLGPLTEETLVRGLVFGTLRKYSRAAAYLAASAVFAAMHMLGYSMTGAELLANALIYGVPSIALCLSYELGGTIWTPILLHMLINGIAMSGIG